MENQNEFKKYYNKLLNEILDTLNKLKEEMNFNLYHNLLDIFNRYKRIYIEFENKQNEHSNKDKRYELKIGKYGFYFYDKTFTKDMELKEVLNRLNYTFVDNITKLEIISIKDKEIYKLKRDLKKYD